MLKNVSAICFLLETSDPFMTLMQPHLYNTPSYMTFPSSTTLAGIKNPSNLPLIDLFLLLYTNCANNRSNDPQASPFCTFYALISVFSTALAFSFSSLSLYTISFALLALSSDSTYVLNLKISVCK
jgi:hypothetical protein